jgi:hypothetical protein
MRSPFISGSIFLGLSLAAVADVVRGTLLNDDDPYFIRGDDGNLYKAEWYGGSSLFSEGDEVILTDSYGLQKMIDDAMDETADVWVKRSRQDILGTIRGPFRHLISLQLLLT